MSRCGILHIFKKFLLGVEIILYLCASSMKYTSLFIDFDDTLYDTHGNAEIALGELYEAFGLHRYFPALESFTVPYWQANVELWGQYSRGEIERNYLIVERFRRPLSQASSPLWHDEESMRKYCLEVSDKFLDLCACKPGLIPGARELLDYLHGRYPLYLCSNGFHEVQYRKLKASDTLRYFDRVILSEDAGANKPSQAFFDYAFRITGADPSATLMIGDNYATDIQGAARAGLDTLLFDRWQDPCATEYTYKVNDLREIISIL